eukprot:TRINITY_DN37413_c0_g1_i1.p1 TRINITY_DN37413_c0_g1~~TRINITY_DN37413_c0_g1_i1.p1  ORF type:complete len:2318 (+),score=456.55 TRINITY_DN37413_c0_g1_i1:451-6954(+)
MVQGRDPKLPRMPRQYGDYAYWQRHWMAQGETDRQLNYWKTQLEGLETLQLPCDFQRPVQQQLTGAQVQVSIDHNTTRRLQSLVRAQGSTLFPALMAAFAATLGRHAGATDVAVASAVSNRDGPELDQLIGYFVNTVIFRLRLGQLNFEQLLQQAKDVVVGAFSHAQAPYASVLEAANVEASAVSAMFQLQDSDVNPWDMQGLDIKMCELPRRAALFDVVLELTEQPTGTITGLLVYNTSIWSHDRAERFVSSFLSLLSSVVCEPASELALVSAASQDDRVQVMQWGNHNKPMARQACCVDGMAAAVAKYPTRPAVIYNQKGLTYFELGTMVEQLSSAIQARISSTSADGQGDVIVGILLGRSIEVSLAIWAVLCAGAAYVPIDPEYPAERIGHILDNARPKLMLCLQKDVHLAGNVPVLAVEDWGVGEFPFLQLPPPGATSPKNDAARPPEEDLQKLAASLRKCKIESQNLAYIIYTSGTTGRPKGVAVEHRAVSNMVQEQVKLMKLTSNDRVLQFFKPAFDGAVQEYLSTFICGAALVLWDNDDGFSDVIFQKRVTAATLTPSALSVLEAARYPHLSQIATAAEALPPAMIKEWCGAGRRLLNAYGPSESCVVATYAEMEAGMQQSPIGRPLNGVTCYVLEPTRCRSLQPIGVPGELCLGGRQLARGYYGDKAKTEEKFLSNPLDGSRMYRTGDVASWSATGQLLYLGRNDEMVKIRGFRIELTEVEAALADAGAIAVSVGVSKAKDALWAWCTVQSKNTTVATLKDKLQDILPQYMIPQRIWILEELPLTPNGKIDKRKLHELGCAALQDVTAIEEEGDFVAPSTPLEEKVSGIVVIALGIERISVTQDLKTAGMTSLKQVLLSQKLRDAGFDVSLSNLYVRKTVQQLTEWLQEERMAENFLAPNEHQLSACQCMQDTVTSTCGLVRFIFRLLAWCWISGVVIWPAVGPLWFISQVALPNGGLNAALVLLIVAGYPLYMLQVALLVIISKWALIGRYKPMSVSVDSWMFFRWWVVDRLHAFTNELVIAPIRGGPLYYAYLVCLGLRSQGYSRLDTKFISEFDLVTLGRQCVIAEGAKVRPAVIEAGMLHLRHITFGDGCVIGVNAVCTAGAVAGNGVTLQPLSMFSGRTGRTLPDGSVWKGAPLVQSRQQPIRPPHGILAVDSLSNTLGMILSLCLIAACSAIGYLAFGGLAYAQGFQYKDASTNCVDWHFTETPEGWLFAAVWLLFGPPVMASADVLLGYDMATYADDAGSCLGSSPMAFGARVTGMIVVSFAAYGWSLTISSALLCRFMRGSRNQNAPLYQVRRVILRMIFPRYPANLNGTGAMSLYMTMLGGSVSPKATVAFADPPLEPRKLHIEADSLVLNAVMLGEGTIRQRSLVGGGAVLLPYAEVDSHAIVAGNAVVGRPVGSKLVLGGNPGVIVKRSELSRPPPVPGRMHCLGREVCRFLFPLLAPMLIQLVLLVTLLPGMYVLTVFLNSIASGPGGFVILCVTLAPVYIILGWCVALITILFKWLLVGRIDVTGRWSWFGSLRSGVLTFVQSLAGLTSGVFMSMAYGSPLYNGWLWSLGVKVEKDALIMVPIMEFDNVHIGKHAVVDRDAAVTGMRLLPAPGGPSEFATCFAKVSVGTRSTISVSATLAAAETGELSVLAPLGAIGPSQKLPTRTMAIGSPAQKFVWSRDEDNLIKPSARPLPRELSQERFSPQYLLRAMQRMKVRTNDTVSIASQDQAGALITGAGGFLGRYITAALLEDTQLKVFCLVRASDAEAAQKRVLDSLRKAGVTSPTMTQRVTAVRGDLSKRHFGMSLADFQKLAGSTHVVFNSAAKVNLAEPFDSMKRDNIDSTAHVLEFCCTGKPKALHHVSTMGVMTPDMLNRRGVVSEASPLGDVRTMPLYGTGDQANGYPYTKWCAERMVFEAGRKGLQVFVHRAGLIGGDSRTGTVAQDVFFHFLSDIVKLRELPNMEGDKFNITPVDWVARSIAHIGTKESFARFAGRAVHPAACNNTVTMVELADVLSEAGYDNLRWVDFCGWRDRILARPQDFKSWSFCAALSVEGNGIDAMADNQVGFMAMREIIGDEAMANMRPRSGLQRMLRFCQEDGLLPRPDGGVAGGGPATAATSGSATATDVPGNGAVAVAPEHSGPPRREAARPLLSDVWPTGGSQGEKA